MRKIEQWMIDVIKSQRLADSAKLRGEGLTNNSGNTMVCTRLRYDHVAVSTVYLHGNLIAQYSNGTWGFKMCGWNTPTTRSRINAIAHEWSRSGVCMRKGVLYSGGKVITSVDWF